MLRHLTKKLRKLLSICDFVLFSFFLSNLGISHLNQLVPSMSSYTLKTRTEKFLSSLSPLTLPFLSLSLCFPLSWSPSLKRAFPFLALWTSHRSLFSAHSYILWLSHLLAIFSHFTVHSFAFFCLSVLHFFLHFRFILSFPTAAIPPSYFLPFRCALDGEVLSACL